MEEFNRDMELDNLNEMVKERLREKQLDTLTESQLDTLEWAKEFMNNYERKHSKDLRERE